MRLNGWQRIGVILTMLWVLLAPLCVLFTDWDNVNNVRQKAFDTCLSTQSQTPHYDCAGFSPIKPIPEYLKDIASDPSSKVLIASIALIPVAVAWIIAYLCFYIIRWIRVGFKHSAHANKVVAVISMASLVSLASCANQQQIISNATNYCPPVGINISAPDFYQKHDPKDVMNFYSCMESELHPSNTPSIGHQGSPAHNLINGADDIKSRLMTDLEFQKSLWMQIFSKEKTPPTAQQTWLQWQQTRQLVSAAHDQANASTRAAQAAQDAPYTQPPPSPLMEGSPVYNAGQCIGAVVNGVCNGTMGAAAAFPVATCHGEMLNGTCTGPMF